MKKLLFFTGLIALIAWGSPGATAELSDDFCTGISIVGPQKVLGSTEKRAYELKNRALRALPADEKWELRELSVQYFHEGFEKMPPAKVRRCRELMEKASRALTPEERGEVEKYGKLIREGKAAASSQGRQPQAGNTISPSPGSGPSGRESLTGEGLHVKKYTRAALIGQAGRGSSSGLSEELRLAGILTAKAGQDGESSLASLRDFSFHGRGRFLFLTYSRDGKSLFVSYMYPSGERERKEYDPRLSDRNVLVRWDTATGKLMEVLLAEKNGACAVAMTRDDGTALYHLDVPGAERLQDGSRETVRNLLFLLDITVGNAAARTVASLAKGDDVLFDAFPVLENIAMSPDGRYVAFTAPFSARPGEGNTIIVETEGGKRHYYPFPYRTSTTGRPNAASLVFSPDGKKLAMGIPSEVERSVAKVAIKIMKTGTWEELQKLPPEKTSFQLGSFILSPDGRRLVRMAIGSPYIRREFIDTGTGKTQGILVYREPHQCFSADGRFYLNFANDCFYTACIDRVPFFWLPRAYFPRSFDGGLFRQAFSPDGCHIALAGKIRGVNALQIIEFNEPDEKKISIFRRAEGALELYRCGMQEEAMAAAQEAIKADPLGLESVGYGERLAAAAMPVFLRGELLLGAYRQASMQKYNRLGLLWKQGEAGMTVTKVNHNTPAQRAGVSEGDIVTGIGGKHFAREGDLLAAWHGLAPEEPAQIEILRKGSPMTLRITPVKACSKHTFLILMEYAQTALEAGHPAKAREAVSLARGWIREGRLYADTDVEELLLVAEAGALAATGKTEQAFDLIAAHRGFAQSGSAELAIMLKPAAFSPLLKDRRRLALAMGFKESHWFPEPLNPGPPQPYPDLQEKR